MMGGRCFTPAGRGWCLLCLKNVSISRLLFRYVPHVVCHSSLDLWLGSVECWSLVVPVVEFMVLFVFKFQLVAVRGLLGVAAPGCPLFLSV